MRVTGRGVPVGFHFLSPRGTTANLHGGWQQCNGLPGEIFGQKGIIFRNEFNKLQFKIYNYRGFKLYKLIYININYSIINFPHNANFGKNTGKEIGIISTKK